MAKWQIESKAGVVLGEYEGETKEDALQQMADHGGITEGLGHPSDYHWTVVEMDEEEPEGRCSNPKGHDWVYTGTAYGGDDESFCGEGRSYCAHCGADGDG